MVASSRPRRLILVVRRRRASRVELDDGFNADNPYHTVALIFYCGFMCERCGEFCSGDDEESSEQTPYRLMAEAVQRAGLLVRGRDAVGYDYEVLCPACAGHHPR